MHRTYVRRRLTVFLAALVISVGAAGPIARAVGAGPAAFRPVASRTYVVEPGDTLWAIATEVAGDRDPRIVVEQIEGANEVDAAGLKPGMVLTLPGVR